MKVFVFDYKKCNGCYNCQLACKDEHVGNEWMPYSLPQPELGHFWLKVSETVHGQTPKVRVEYTPHLCNHCDNAPCIAAAPDAVYKRPDGLVIIDPAKAQDNKDLVEACPYGAIYYNDELGIAQKCTGCAHLVDEGKMPHCVDLCVVGALRFGEEADFAEELAQATVLAVSEHGPRVFYLSAPGLFIGGEVWDPAKDEVIEGALIHLSSDSGLHRKTQSDDFGDFWFKQLAKGSYHLSIQADGYQAQELDIVLDKSLNIGDVALQKP